MPPKNIVVITARHDSDRLPGKAIVPICGTPNLVRIVQRFRRCKNIQQVIVATTTRREDNVIVQECEHHGIECHRGSYEDVTRRVFEAAQSASASYVLRATADCPFVSWELVDMGFAIIQQHKADAARIWGMPDRGTPIYGAAEFPYSYNAINLMDGESKGEEREHPGMHLDRNRAKYKVIYPVPPMIYFDTFYHPYRLELDTPDDLKVVERVIADLGDLPPLHNVVRYLDAHIDVAQMNSHIAEKTGPMTSFPPQTRAYWKMDQVQNKTVEWTGDWTWLLSGSPSNLPKYAKPVYCGKGKCFVGYSVCGKDRIWRLHRPDGAILTGYAELTCVCGAGRIWHEDAKR